MGDDDVGGSDSIVLEEEIDPNYVPTAEEVALCLCIASLLFSCCLGVVLSCLSFLFVLVVVLCVCLCVLVLLFPTSR
jgi:hypothetical protein